MGYVGGITHINMVHGTISLANCRKFVAIFAVLPASGDVSWKLWDHSGAEVSSRKHSKVAGPVAAGWHRGGAELVCLHL